MKSIVLAGAVVTALLPPILGAQDSPLGIQSNAGGHPEMRLPDGSFTASGNGGQRLTVIPQIETVIVNLMNTDEPGPRLGSNQWDALLADILAARR